MTANITLTQAQLDQMIAGAVAAAIAGINAAAAAAPVLAITLNTHEKLGKYKGEKGWDVERFISQCDAYYALSGVASDKNRVISALSRLEHKAAQWAIHVTDHMAAHNGRLPDDVNTWAKFKALLRKYFGDATPEDKAIIELDQPCDLESKVCAARDVGHYVSEFQALVACIDGLSDKDKEIRFTKGLPNCIFATLAVADPPPADYDQWVDRSLKMYAAFERICEKEAADKIKITATTTHRPAAQTAYPRFIPRQTTSAPTNPNHIPMNVDASHRSSDSCKCYNYNQLGHIARYCP